MNSSNLIEPANESSRRLAPPRRAVEPSARPGTEPVLADTRNLLETLLQNSPDTIYFKDLQSRFVRFSKAFEKLFGITDLESIKGKTDADFFTPEHAQQAYSDEQEIIRSGQPIIGKLEKETHTNGRVTWALTSKMPWRDGDGRIIGTFGISKNVTALKEAEAKLASKEELLRALLDNVPDAIYFKDRQSRLVELSRSTMLKFLQHSSKLPARLAQPAARPDSSPESLKPEMFRGLTDFDMFAREHAGRAFEDEQEIIRTGRPILDKLEKETHLDGGVTWCLSTKMPWRDSEGTVIGTFGISRDITALKRTEAELEAAHKRVVETSRLAGMAEVATDVLHNVGNTLNSINVSCSLVIDRVKQSNLNNLPRIAGLLREQAGHLDQFLTSDPQGKHIPEYLAGLAQKFEAQKDFLLGELEQLRDHVNHVNQIIAMQQSYAKVAGVKEVIELDQLVDDALRINAAALDRHVVQVRRETQPVPPLLIDKHKVLQILINLIRNAKYAMSEAERPDKVLTVRVGPNGSGQVAIQIMDNGVGIPPENLTRIFAHGFTTRRGGHGFGLHSGALAARELGGALTVHSDGPGKGATFTLTLPLEPAQAS